VAVLIGEVLVVVGTGVIDGFKVGAFVEVGVASIPTRNDRLMNKISTQKVFEKLD
jgi:hypothetical protein